MECVSFVCREPFVNLVPALLDLLDASEKAIANNRDRIRLNASDLDDLRSTSTALVQVIYQISCLQPGCKHPLEYAIKSHSWQQAVSYLLEMLTTLIDYEQRQEVVWSIVLVLHGQLILAMSGSPQSKLTQSIVCTTSIIIAAIDRAEQMLPAQITSSHRNRMSVAQRQSVSNKLISSRDRPLLQDANHLAVRIASSFQDGNIPARYLPEIERAMQSLTAKIGTLPNDLSPVLRENWAIYHQLYPQLSS